VTWHFPLFHRVIDCGFGIFGFVPLWLARRAILQLDPGPGLSIVSGLKPVNTRAARADKRGGDGRKENGKMLALPLGSHEQLQATADWLVSLFRHREPEVLRFAILEVLQNVVQHGNGLCFVETGEDWVVVTNLARESSRPCAHLGLHLIEGVRVQQVRNAFRAVIFVDEVALRPLDGLPVHLHDIA
jgi:hypothetical protein